MPVAASGLPERDDCRARWTSVRPKPLSMAYLQGLRAPGVIAGDAPVMLAAESAGMVTEVLIRPGDAVHAGQPLFRLSSEELDRDGGLLARDLEMARQDVIKQRERAKSIASNLQRHRIYPDLFAKNEIDSLEADRVGADAEVRQSQLRLQQIALKQSSLARAREHLVVRAPRAGRVRRVSVRTGIRVEAGATLAELGTGGEKTLRFALPAAAAAMLDRDAIVCVVIPEKHRVAAVRIDRVRRQMLDAGETVSLETGIGAAAAWPVGIAVDVLPPVGAR